MSRGFGFGYSLEDAFSSRTTPQSLTPPVTVNDSAPRHASPPTAEPPEAARAAVPQTRSSSRSRSRPRHSQSRHRRDRGRRSSRRSRRSRMASASSDSSTSNSSYAETDSTSDDESDDDDDDDDDESQSPPPPPPPPPVSPVSPQPVSQSQPAAAVFVPTTAAETSAYAIFAGRADAASWSLPPSVTGRTLGPGGPGVPENPWPETPRGGPMPGLHMDDSRLLNGGRVFNSDFAGSFTDPNTGIVYAAYTDPMPEPKVLRDTPDLQLGKPNRMLEALSGISALQRPVRQEIVNDFQDAVEGLLLPHSILEMQVRSETEKRDARELFFTNREAEAGHADTHWDGYIGSTYVLRPTYDTQTVRENDESNTTVLPFRQNPDGNLAVPMFRAPTEFGGVMQPAVEILAEDKAFGLPHLHHDFQVDNARLLQITDSANLPTERVNHGSRATINATIPWETSISPAYSDSVVDRARVSAPGVVSANAYGYADNIRAPPVTPHERAYGDAKITARSSIPTLNMSNLLAATAVDDTAFFGDSRPVSYYSRASEHTTSSGAAALPPVVRDSVRGQDSTTMRAFGNQTQTMPQAAAAFTTAREGARAAQDSSVIQALRHVHAAAADAVGSGSRMAAAVSEHATERGRAALPTAKRIEVGMSTSLLAVDASSGTRDSEVRAAAGNAVSLAGSNGSASAAVGNVQTYHAASSTSLETVSHQPARVALDVHGHSLQGASDTATPGDAVAGKTFRGNVLVGGGSMSSGMSPATPAYAGDSEAAATLRAHAGVDSTTYAPTALASASAGKNTGDSTVAAMKNTGTHSIALDGTASRLQASAGGGYAGDTAVALHRRGDHAALGESGNAPNLPAVMDSAGAGDSTAGAARAGVQQHQAFFSHASSLPQPVGQSARDATLGTVRTNPNHTQFSASAVSAPLQPAASGFAGDAASGAQRPTVQPTALAAASASLQYAASGFVGDAASGAQRPTVQPTALAAASASLQYAASGFAGDAASGAQRPTVQPTALAAASASLQHAASEFAGDAASGAQRPTPQSDTMPAASFPTSSDRGFTEKLIVPGRVSNSRVFSWTGQSLAADAVPSIFKLAGESDGLHAQDNYTSYERAVREENIKARPDGIADFRNAYTADGRKKDEADIWRGRSNGPSRHVIEALLQNQLYELSQQQPTQPPTPMEEAMRVAYESDY